MMTKRIPIADFVLPKKDRFVQVNEMNTGRLIWFGVVMSSQKRRGILDDGSVFFPRSMKFSRTGRPSADIVDAVLTLADPNCMRSSIIEAEKARTEVRRSEQRQAKAMDRIEEGVRMLKSGTSSAEGATNRSPLDWWHNRRRAV